MKHEDLEARLDSRLIRTLNDMTPEAFKDLITELLERMGLQITRTELEKDLVFLEAEKGEESYLVMASRKPEHASAQGVRIIKDKASVEKRLPVLIVSHDLDAKSKELAFSEGVSFSDKERTILLIRKYGLWQRLTEHVDRSILQREGRRILPSTMPFDSHLQRAAEALKGKDSRTALEHIKAALELKPQYDLAWRMKAQAHYDLEEWDDALEAIGEALKAKPDDPLSWYFAGLVLHQLGDLEKELRAYDKALKYAPRLQPALLNKGATQFALGLKEEALFTFEEILRHHPNDVQALRNKALVLESMGRRSEALKVLDSLISLNPNDVEILVMRASMLAQEKHLLEAIEAWRQAVALDGSRADLWLGLTRAQLTAGMLEDAKRSYQMVRKLDANAPYIDELKITTGTSPLSSTVKHHNLQEDSLLRRCLDAALLMQALGRYEEALSEVERALTFDRNNVWALRRKASLLLDLGRLEEAVSLLTAAMREKNTSIELALELEAIGHRLGKKEESAWILQPHSDDGEVRKRLAIRHIIAGRPKAALELLGSPAGEDLCHDRLICVALLSDGNYPKASDLLEELLKKYGSSPALLNDLAVALRFQGKMEEAEKALCEVVRIEPRHANAWNNLGCLQYLKGALEEAERSIKKAVLLDRRPEFLLNLGMVQLSRDDFKAAQSSFEASLWLDPTPEALNCLGMLAERKGDSEKALEFYEEAIKKAPEFGEAQSNKARLRASFKAN
ncbi:MAG: tetratricopeptide repeat protein [Methanomassiliicoccales archaeon]